MRVETIIRKGKELAVIPVASLQKLMEESNLSVGGHVLFAHYQQGMTDYLAIALLHHSEGVAVNAEPPANKLMPLERASAEPAALRAPANLPQAVIQVPKRDADGNPLGGVRLPDVAVPVGTNGGQNIPHTFICSLVGSYAAFAATKAQREAASDARLSVAERYRNRDDYVNRVRIAAQDLLQQGFLLPEDAAVIIDAAASSPAFAPASPAPH